MARRIKFGVTLPQFGATWPEVRDMALLADEAGFDSVWVADHFFGVGSDDPLEAWTEMSAVAAITRRVEIGFLVLCNSYRPPALLAKMAATFDQIADGRLILGYGAGWFVMEYEAYGYEFPPIGTRLAQLEEGLRILKAMWTEDAPTFHGRHYRIDGARCRPRAVRKPHPPILIGGGGERKTLRLVAQYAQACNLFGSPELEHKLDVLRQRCDEVGRDYDEIEKTVMLPIDPGPDGANVDNLLRTLEDLSKLGVAHVHSRIAGVEQIRPLEILGERVIPQIADL